MRTSHLKKPKDLASTSWRSDGSPRLTDFKVLRDFRSSQEPSLSEIRKKTFLWSFVNFACWTRSQSPSHSKMTTCKRRTITRLFVSLIRRNRKLLTNWPDSGVQFVQSFRTQSFRRHSADTVTHTVIRLLCWPIEREINFLDNSPKA